MVPEHLHGWKSGWLGSAGALHILQVSAYKLSVCLSVDRRNRCDLDPRALAPDDTDALLRKECGLR
jgi:hypothetical protein